MKSRNGLKWCGFALLVIVVTGIAGVVFQWILVVWLAVIAIVLAPAICIVILLAHSERPSTVDDYLASLEWNRVPNCETCGYPTRGLPPDAPCPECGAPVPSMWVAPDSETGSIASSNAGSRHRHQS